MGAGGVRYRIGAGPPEDNMPRRGAGGVARRRWRGLFGIWAWCSEGSLIAGWNSAGEFWVVRPVQLVQPIEALRRIATY